jgi:DNA-binding NarL/FixJ family response regulator
VIERITDMTYAPDSTRVLTITDNSLFYLRVHHACVWEFGTEIMLTSNTTEKALQKVTQLAPDIILVDGDLPDNDAISVCSDIIRNGYIGDIILFEMDFERAKTARELGVTTCLPQDIGYRELLSSIRLIRQRERSLNNTCFKDYSLLYRRRNADNLSSFGNPNGNYLMPESQKNTGSVKVKKLNTIISSVLPWLRTASVHVVSSGVLKNIQRVLRGK